MPLYHDTLRSLGLYPDDIASKEDLRKLPILTKDNIRLNYPRRITSLSKSASIVRVTSGTTGQPLRVLLDDRCADVYFALRVRRLLISGIRPWEQLAYLSTGGISIDRTSPESTSIPGKLASLLIGSKNVAYPGIRREIFKLGPRNLQQVAQSLLKFRPDLLLGRPSQLRRLANEITRLGSKLRVRNVLVGGEIVTRECKKEMHNFYDGNVFEIFGSHELGPLAWNAKRTKGFTFTRIS